MSAYTGLYRAHNSGFSSSRDGSVSPSSLLSGAALTSYSFISFLSRLLGELGREVAKATPTTRASRPGSLTAWADTPYGRCSGNRVRQVAHPPRGGYVGERRGSQLAIPLLPCLFEASSPRWALSHFLGLSACFPCSSLTEVSRLWS